MSANKKAATGWHPQTALVNRTRPTFYFDTEIGDVRRTDRQAPLAWSFPERNGSYAAPGEDCRDCMYRRGYHCGLFDRRFDAFALFEGCAEHAGAVH